MDSDGPGTWTLDEHLAHGRVAVHEISALPPDTIANPRVCFHFSPINSEDDENWGMEAGYCVRAEREFARASEEFDVDYVGGLSGIEAWQLVIPNLRWLERTIPIASAIAEKSGLGFAGWSFEPLRGPFITVSPTLNVFDGSNLSELPPESARQSFQGLRDWLRNKLGH